MPEWFQAKVKFLRQMDNGLIKQSTELYLIDAVCFADAETRAFKEAGDNRDVQAVAISRSPIKEVVFYGDTDMWHKVKVTWSDLDEVTEKEKKITTYFLVNANDAKEAYERTEEHLKEMLVPFKIPKVEESPIIDVYQYEKAAPKGFVKVETLASIAAIDPTDGQAVGFYATLEDYLKEIRPELPIRDIERIRDAYDSGKGFFDPWLQDNHFSDDQIEKIRDFCANDAAFEADEDENHTDLESRFDAAMNRS